jgi:flagellar basal-body rod protein FlgB
VLAENVANADTPGFQARDLRPLKFEPAGEGASGVQPVALATTERGHIASLGPTPNSFRSHSDGHYEIRPTGNAVNLEEEMMKVAANQMDFQTATALYTHSLNLIKIALGKR